MAAASALQPKRKAARAALASFGGFLSSGRLLRPVIIGVTRSCRITAAYNRIAITCKTVAANRASQKYECKSVMRLAMTDGTIVDALWALAIKAAEAYSSDDSAGGNAPPLRRTERRL